MAELEVDQTNLPRVQEVCQCFAVLEDGALAHNLQEQEIEQYYTSNVQRSQLVQKDIRVAKRLQDEEKHTAQLLQQQTTRTLEEHDSEYARMIQEEIQRCAEEARRRELEDEEIAKRIQEEEVLCVRSRGRFQNRDCRDTSSVPSHFHQAVHMPEDQYYKQASTRRWRNSPSPPESDSEDDNSRSTVSSRTQVCQEQRMPLRFNRPSRSHSDPDNRSTVSGSTSSQKSRMSHLSGGWGDVIKLIKNDMSEQGYQSPSSEDELFEPVYKLEKILKQKQPALDQFRSRGTSLSRHESVREDRRQLRWRDSCFRERDRDRHVHFLDERRCVNGYYGNGYSVHTNGDTRERGLLLNGTLRDNHPHPGEILDDGQQTQTPGFRRNVSMRRSYHGDVRLNRRTSVREASRTCIQDDSNLVNRVRTVNNSQMMETEGRRPGPLREVGRLEVARNQQQRDSLLTEKRMNDRDHRRYPGQHRLSHSISEHWQSLEEERSSSEEEMMSRREVRCIERRPSRNTCQSRSDHSPKAGATGRGGTTALDLGELEQVLLDEELARRLQEEEERLASETQQEYSPLKGTCPEDFKMAQVAQDEEIAHFIQKQEIKAKRRSAELDSVGPRREYRDTVFEYERRPECERQRERMGSEGLQSPFDDFTDHQPSSTISIAAQPTRNIAEDLDPTFRKEINGASQNQGSQGVYNPIEEQPTIVPPTKRQNDKPGRAKPKDKKENIKQKENCKQQ